MGSFFPGKVTGMVVWPGSSMEPRPYGLSWGAGYRVVIFTDLVNRLQDQLAKGLGEIVGKYLRLLGKIEGSWEVLSRESRLRLIEEALNRLIRFLLIGRQFSRVDRLDLSLRALNPLVRLIYQSLLLVPAHLRREERRRLGCRRQATRRGLRRRKYRFHLSAASRQHKGQNHEKEAGTHDAVSVAGCYGAGKVTVIVVPPPTFESTSMFPPCIWTIR